MPLEYDVAYLEAARPILELRRNTPKPAKFDFDRARNEAAQLFHLLLANDEGVIEEPDLDGIYHTEAADGCQLEIHHYIPRRYPDSESEEPAASESVKPTEPALYHIHGGTLLSTKASMFGSLCRLIAQASQAQVFAIAHRSTPDHPLPLPLTDCYTGLKWLQASAQQFNVDPARIAVVGESEGGGLAAALCLYAKSQQFSPMIKKVQMMYPRLDDRNLIPDPELDNEDLMLSYEMRRAGWEAELGKDRVGKDGVTCLEAPARATEDELKGFPQTYIDVGSMDIYRDESIEFARKLWAVGTPVELHVWPGVPHIFELLAPEIPITQLAMQRRVAFWDDL